MIEVEWDPVPLANVIAKTKFLWPEWMIYLSRDNEGTGAPTLHIVSATPNSYDVEQLIRVNHSFLVPLASYNERTWKAWIHSCYVKVMTHEIGEMLTFDGVREFGPHHANGEDPYMIWHIGDYEDTKVKAGQDR